ncbi:hypothetical protein OG21DRAFT_1374340, partial [Imleria badia]
DLRDNEIPHRTKLHKLVLKAWKEYFVAVKQNLANAAGRISFTTDIWSDSEMHPYLALMAHWIANE